MTSLCHSLRKVLAIVPLRKFHVQQDLCRGFCICQHEVYLPASPSDDCQHKEEMNGLPRDDWSIHFPIIDASLLLTTMYVESCLPFIDFACVNTPFALHGPHHVQYSGPFWYFASGDYFPVSVSYVILALLVHGSLELVSIGRLLGFMKVHDVWIRTRGVHHGLLHIFLYFVLPLGRQ